MRPSGPQSCKTSPKAQAWQARDMSMQSSAQSNICRAWHPPLYGHLICPPPPFNGTQQLSVLCFATQLALSSRWNRGQFTFNDIIVRWVTAVGSRLSLDKRRPVPVFPTGRHGGSAVAASQSRRASLNPSPAACFLPVHRRSVVENWVQIH